MRKFLIYTNKSKDPELETTGKICDYLKTQGISTEVVVSRRDTPYDEKIEMGDDEMPELVLVLGGDGTVLQASRETSECGAPIAGINLGNVGYLTEVEINGIEEALDRFVSGDYHIEHRMMLDGEINQEASCSVALNDIVVSKHGKTGVLDVVIYVNGMLLNSYRADGMILTTPTGSTGYNLSAGGPIASPESDILIMTPICPHTITQRSIVLPAGDVVEIEIPQARDGEEQEADVIFDGKPLALIKTGDRIVVKRSEKKTDFARLDNTSFLDVLHRKLGGY